MQESSQNHGIIPQKYNFSSRVVMFLLILSIITTGGLYGYNIYLSSKIEKEQAIIAHKEKEIGEISKDRDIIIANIISSTTLRPSLDIKFLVTQFREVALRSGVRLKGFSVAKDTINTTLIATEGDPQLHPDPAATIIRMMREYASTQKYFSLEPILSLSGDEKKRTTNITLKIVPKNQ